MALFRKRGGNDAEGPASDLSDAEIGDKAFSNPPSDLSSPEQQAVRIAIGAATRTGSELSDADIGDKAFSNPPNDLNDAEKSTARTAIGAGTSSFDGTYSALTGQPTIPASLSDAEIGDKAFSNPPNNLNDAEKSTAREAIGAGTSSFDGDNAFVDASETGGTLTLIRSGGTNPLDVAITGAGGAFELKPVGTRQTITFASTLVATGITPPALDPDEVLYLRITVPDEGEPPHYHIMRGATYAALTVAAAGDAPSGTRWERAGPVTAGVIAVQKNAAGELLIASADHSGSDGWMEAYTVSLGAGGSLGMIPLGSANYDVTTGNQLVAEGPGQMPIDMSGVDPAKDIIGVKVDYASGDSTFDDVRLVDARELLAENAGVMLSAAQQSRPTLGGNAAVTGPSVWLSIDSDGHLAVTTGGVTTDPMPITVWRFGRATAVAPNPPGTDGGTLNRVRVQGRNYNLPGASVLSAVKMNLQDVTAAVISTDYSGTHFKPTLAGARWNRGGFTLDGDKVVIPHDGLFQIHSEILMTSTSGNNTIFTRYRIERDGAVIGASASEGSDYVRGSSSQNESVIEHDDWHILMAGDKLLVDFRGLASAPSYAVTGARSFLVLIGFQAPQASRTPSAHQRYIGWSAAQNPTAQEFGTFASETDDTLAVPALPAAFATAGGAFLVIAVPKDQGVPTGFYRSGNPINVIGSWVRVNDWMPQGSGSHYVYATEVAQSATSLAGASYRIEYGGTV